jgi:hypothetical protein
MRRLLIVIFVGALGAGCGDHQPNVGATCTATGGCDTGLTCNLAVPGGYCTQPCVTPGIRSGCPDGALCDTLGSTPSCTRVCNIQQDCRADLECNGTTGSSLKTCKPKT